ncbi:MAG: N-acetylglucosamine-6-phosphate deacetylase [Acidobacteriota bacterium]|nr:N-acetylglucosamine-6-phosphate deacetylase [Acidobacteriota bacterium]
MAAERSIDSVMILSGADIVLPGRILSPGTIVLDGTRIAEVTPGTRTREHPAFLDLSNHYIVPGFIDVHVHGLEGLDTLQGGDAIRSMALRLPRFGVTAFCPTTIACAPAALREVLRAVGAARAHPAPLAARVLPAHLESNFINPEFNGAQPLECLRSPRGAGPEGEFTGADILAEIAAARPDVGILTIAPELDGAIPLIRDLTAHGHHVSLGHSGATYEDALAGVDAGARQATHLFNRMTPLNHRQPGLAAAVLEHDDVTAELICDGMHVHPAMVRVALAAKQTSRIMAITDGTAGAGLPRGARSTIGGRPITVGDVATLDDGTLAGSVLTMDRAFGRLVTGMGVSLVDAATVCATTPARTLNLQGLGVIAPGATADLVVLDARLNVVHTFLDGSLVWSAAPGAA